jgi:hypothetical protein
MGLCAQASALSDQELEAMDAQYEKQANTYIEKYTDPAFLKTIEEPELVRQEQQHSKNATLLFSFNNPLSNINKSFGIYVYDLLFCSHACGSWFLEWILYKQLSAYCETHEKNHTKQLTIIIGYVVTSLLLHQMGQYFLLDVSPSQAMLNNEHPSLCGTIAYQFPTVIHYIANPMAWTTMVNGFFKQWGMLPGWTDYMSYKITQNIIIMLVFVWWYERSYEKKQSFIEWMKTKTTAVTTIQCIADISVALPAYVKIARWAYTIGKQVVSILWPYNPETIPEK